MPETRTIVLWTFENAKGDLLFPQTSLQQIFKNDDPNTRISRNGVILREHVPHDVTPIIGRFDNSHIPDPDNYPVGSKYYNTSTNKIHTDKENTDGTQGHRWTDGTAIEEDRLLIDISNNHAYHYHDGQLHDVSGSGGGLGNLVFVAD